MAGLLKRGKLVLQSQQPGSQLVIPQLVCVVVLGNQVFSHVVDILLDFLQPGLGLSIELQVFLDLLLLLLVHGIMVVVLFGNQIFIEFLHFL